MEHRRYTFPRSHRLSGQNAFARVFDARVRESRGPLTAYAVPNDLNHPRLGISISRKVGTAPRRNRIKRLLADYQKLMTHLMLKLHAAWQKRGPAPSGMERPPKDG